MPKGIIFTPHPKELQRLEGHSNDSFELLSKALSLAERVQGYVILKGHHSALCLPDGHVIFNSTGNAGMATAGSGDVLTGIIEATNNRMPVSSACIYTDLQVTSLPANWDRRV